MPAADGLGERAERALAVVAEQPGGATVAELVAVVGGHPNAVRQHLGALLDRAFVVAEQGSPSGRGRPAVRYVVTAAGQRHLDRAKTPHTARGHVVWMLDRLGFTPVPDEADVVQLTTCPLLEEARAAPQVVCRVHRDLIRDTLRAHGAADDGVDLAPFSDPGWCRLVLPEVSDAGARAP